MNSRIGIALFVLVVAAMGWVLKTQTDINREQMNEIRDLRASLTKNASQRANTAQTSAAEIFRLRTMCAELGKGILDDSVVGSALAQNQVSHYDPRANRCYVELTVQTADTTKGLDYLTRYLFDGQTKEMLAFARIQKDKKVGSVFDKQHRTTTLENAGWDDASAYIDATMLDDRR